MKKIVTGLCLLTLCFSCENKRARIDPFVSITKSIDSLMTGKDTLDNPLPADTVVEVQKADGPFDDFIYNYASDENLQLRRIKFPLPYYNIDTPSKIEKEDWKHDCLFTNQNNYTLLFDKEDDLDVVGDTALNSVQVEWFFLKTGLAKRYYFERIKGLWMLEAINLRRIEKGKGDDFFSFYYRFATDSLFQRKHIAQPLRFVTIDPDDEFSILETTLDIDQWAAFRPVLPEDKLSNINYGQENKDDSNTKILKVNGAGNGYSTIFYFRRRGMHWELYKYEDSSI